MGSFPTFYLVDSIRNPSVAVYKSSLNMSSFSTLSTLLTPSQSTKKKNVCRVIYHESGVVIVCMGKIVLNFVCILNGQTFFKKSYVFLRPCPFPTPLFMHAPYFQPVDTHTLLLLLAKLVTVLCISLFMRHMLGKVVKNHVFFCIS